MKNANDLIVNVYGERRWDASTNPTPDGTAAGWLGGT